jgi:hypothetical protein
MHFIHSSGLNGVNPGVYYTGVNQWTIGTYLNSYKKETVYVARMWETDSKMFALSAGLATGYAGVCRAVCNALTPIIAPSMKLGPVRLTVPNLQGVHLSLEYAL